MHNHPLHHIYIPLNLHVHHQRINKPLLIKTPSTFPFPLQHSFTKNHTLLHSFSFHPPLSFSIFSTKNHPNPSFISKYSPHHISPIFPLFSTSMIPKFAIHKVYLFFLLHLLDHNREQSSQIHSKTKSVRTTQRRTHYHPISQCISLYSFLLIQ